MQRVVKSIFALFSGNEFVLNGDKKDLQKKVYQYLQEKLIGV
jgi:uncharacterized protein YuzB (UPF0349 family)